MQLADLEFVLGSGFGVPLPIVTGSWAEGDVWTKYSGSGDPRPGGHRELGGWEHVELHG